jgi:hypothetical protein
MIDAQWASSLVHTGWGVALYAVFQAWGILSETTAPDAPSRRAHGMNSFVLGQAVAIVGVVGVALLCGRVLFQTLQTYDIQTVSLWVAGALTLVEAISAFLGFPLVNEREPLTRIDFAGGRDLILRHGSALFLGLAATSSWLGPATSATVAGGCVLGWGATQAMAGPARHTPLLSWSRHLASILGLGMGIMLLRAALKWS